jgi:MerR-like DNA binding protein
MGIISMFGFQDAISCGGAGMKTILTPSDVARRLGITPDAVRAMERAGRISVAGRTLRGNRLFSEVEVLRVIEDRKKRATPAK